MSLQCGRKMMLRQKLLIYLEWVKKNKIMVHCMKKPIFSTFIIRFQCPFDITSISFMLYANKRSLSKNGADYE